jgi:hypothetical protein
VDDDVVAALESALADLGTLLVQMDKFRAGAGDDARALRAACLAIGDRARRAHRHGGLDEVLAVELRADTEAARAGLARWLDGMRRSDLYVRSTAALARGDLATLRGTLPALFAGTRAEPPPPALFHPVAWQRRGRPRPPADIADELGRWREDGLPGDGDVAAPGVDPALPGVSLLATPPVGAPLHLVIAERDCPPWVLRLEATGDVVVPGERLRVPFAVALADPDDDLDAWTLDPVALRRDLAAALAARAIPLATPVGD